MSTLAVAAMETGKFSLLLSAIRPISLKRIFSFISECESILCTEQLFLCSAATSVENADTSFIEDAVHGLLNSRRVLRASYAYGFFLTGNKDKRVIFESMQASVKAIFNCVSKAIRG